MNIEVYKKIVLYNFFYFPVAIDFRQVLKLFCCDLTMQKNYKYKIKLITVYYRPGDKHAICTNFYYSITVYYALAIRASKAIFSALTRSTFRNTKE